MTVTDHRVTPTDESDAGNRRRVGTHDQKSSMASKIPVALLIVALLIFIPTGVRLIAGGDDGEPTLTPGRFDDRAEPAEQVTFWRNRVVNDLDYLNRNQLAVALLEQARQTGDLGSYGEAESVIAESLEANPQGVEGRAIAAAVQYGIHEFPAALESAESILDEEPNSIQALSVAGDAALEIGRYEDADRYYSQLYASRPGPASAVRLARLEWQRGNAELAVSRAREALASANASRLPPSDVAFYALQLATFLLDTGEVEEAESLAAESVIIAPELPAAHAIQGRALAARGRIDEAIDRYEQAVAIIPRPEYLGALGDLYTVAGEPEAAEQQYQAVELIAQIADIEQVVYNRELARFFADHDRETGRAVEMARAELEVRADVLGYDTLAWALFQNGDVAEAEAVVEELRAFDTADPEVLYHIGMILGAAGDTEAAVDHLERALDVSPSFDPIQAPMAEAMLDDLRATR